MLGLSFTLVAIALATIYFYVKYLYSYWQRLGIPYLKPSFPFDNFGKIITQRIPLGEQLGELYRSTTEPFIGIFMLFRPMLLIRDPNLIRSILITDFQYFTDREFYSNVKDEPLTSNLISLKGKKWREKRVKLTPAFTSNKLKMIFPVLLDCGNQLQRHLTKMLNTNRSIEMYEISASYASNVVASVVYGIDIDCLANLKHPFRNAVHKVHEINLKNAFRFIGWFFLPKLLKWSGLGFVDREVEEYFLKLTAQTLKMRERKI